MNNNTGTQNALEETDLSNGAVQGENTSLTESLSDTVEPYTERIAEKLTAVKLKVSDNLSGAAEKIHSSSDAAQDYLFDKSDKVNTFAHHTIEKANNLGHRAADALDASSGYIKNFDLAETKGQVLNTVKERPEISLAIAGFSGLLIGLLIGRSLKR
jgi:ElaB/YqjD/DUF883 family membrane-anchored ribosome-binding protein